jgi:hypothetical protein
VHLPSENGVSVAFLICDIAVRPIPERMHNSALLNCRYGNFAARKSNAATVADENESVSARLSCFAEFVFIWIIICSYEHLRQELADGHFAEGEGEIPRYSLARGTLSKNFAGLPRTFPARRRKPEKKRSASNKANKKPGVEPFVFARLLEQVRRSERDMEPQLTLFMTDIQLKKLVNEAVSLHRALTTYSERLKALKADLIREAQRHKADFTITEGGGSRWTASGTDGCIARVNFPAPALLSHIDTEDETFDNILALAGELLDELFESRHYLKPVADFRDEVAAALPRRTAAQLIELCQVECSPRVSFETAETKTKER